MLLQTADRSLHCRRRDHAVGTQQCPDGRWPRSVPRPADTSMSGTASAGPRPSAVDSATPAHRRAAAPCRREGLAPGSVSRCRTASRPEHPLTRDQGAEGHGGDEQPLLQRSGVGNRRAGLVATSMVAEGAPAARPTTEADATAPTPSPDPRRCPAGRTRRVTSPSKPAGNSQACCQPSTRTAVNVTPSARATQPDYRSPGRSAMRPRCSSRRRPGGCFPTV